MTPAGIDSSRNNKLIKFFHDVHKGIRTINTPRDARLFQEAIPCKAPPSLCVELLASSAAAIEALRVSIRADLNPQTIEQLTIPLLAFLADPAAKLLADGQLTARVVETIIQPPTFWKAITKLFLEHRLPESGLQAFAWLTYEVICLPSSSANGLIEDVSAIDRDRGLLSSPYPETRSLGYKIQKALQLRSANVEPGPNLSTATPGGRHDNDFADFRRIEIFPTSDELHSTEQPFYRLASEAFDIEPEERAAIHLDNQFRLLREDMLAELRADLHAAASKKKGRITGCCLRGLVPIDIDSGERDRAKRCSLLLNCFQGLESLQTKDPSARKRFIEANKNFLRHQAFGVLCRGQLIYGFAFIDRDVSGLLKSPPVVKLQLTDSRALGRCLAAFKLYKDVQFIVVDTPVFAYQPILEGIKGIHNLPLGSQLLDPTKASDPLKHGDRMSDFLGKLASLKLSEGSSLTFDDVTLDSIQYEALCSALGEKTTIIQGPPGTGKSFIGSLILKYRYRYSDARFLVLSYTNHALDQFMEDLLDVGIPEWDMVRLGSKSTTRTAPLLLKEHRSGAKRSQGTWTVINDLKCDRSVLQHRLESAWDVYNQVQVTFTSIMEYLEFSEDYERFHESFSLPTVSAYWKGVGRKGKEVEPDYLYTRWIRGKDAGLYQLQINDSTIWLIAPSERLTLRNRWAQKIIAERVEALQLIVEDLNRNDEALKKAFNENQVEILNTKRIVACTTTAAAMYNSLLRATKPEVVLVEEAGEILECHTLTALTPSVKQMVLIGDHKQLRPKINNHELSVEKGLGFDLNRSLFERLILQGHKHTTLRKQHRMHPAISAFPRALTYPELLDGPRVEEHCKINGLNDRVIFIHHENPETDDQHLADRRDPTVKSSRQNEFEVDMILKIVAYLSQQGYTTNQMAVLTPYLGQLRLLRDKLMKEMDPVLNDSDAHDLVRAGLMTQAAAKVDRKPLQLSTIDNYQGEESDIIVTSLTRSNSKGDIGFLAAPERLNVLLTRARRCIIMIGNMQTFLANRRARETWQPFFKLLQQNGHLYDGLPVHCQRHPEKTAVLQVPNDFTRHCPDGGCAEPCKSPLPCGLHNCPLRCHRIADHSKSECRELIEQTCDRQHRRKVRCSQTAQRCRDCVREDQELERRLRRDLDLEKARLSREEAYRKELQTIEDEIDYQRRQMQLMQDEDNQVKEIAQKRKNARQLQTQVASLREGKAKEERRKAAASKLETKRHGTPESRGPSHEDWLWLKENSGAESDAMDALMEMIGLEEVKQSFLTVKIKVDLMIKQEVSLADDRFSCVMLGNPGTGKTTVARLYSRFLCSVGVIPGDCLKETTGSALASAGIAEAKKLIDELMNSNGGVLFIDEAYQLTSGNNPGGRAVLDYLLSEVENLRGKVVFVLAGYGKEMESIFAHNPGIPSRFPVEMRFTDYTDEQLLRIFDLIMSKKYSGQMKCEGGSDGLYCRIVSRRIGRGRGKPGFGNARAVENVASQIINRQATRIFQLQREKKITDELLLSKEDMIGPEPSSTLDSCPSWQKLQSLIGLSKVKNAVAALVDTIQQNYIRELQEEPLVEFSLQKCFLGNPGTGKTTVAKLYGEILANLGLLSKGEVVVKNPSDFVGDVIGASEKQTKGILAASVGKVLVIDEAYALFGGTGNGSMGGTDPYKTAVIDTIVAEVQGVPGDDRCVLLLGYEDQMEEMFRNVNPGLSRRFPLPSAFVFSDFDKDELRLILELKLESQGFTADNYSKQVALEILERARNRPHFGNAGEIDILLDAAKANLQRRLSQGKVERAAAAVLEAIDFDQDHDRAERTQSNIKRLFEDSVGCEDTIRLLEGYQETVRLTRSLGLDPRARVPYCFLFRGPPGTGKTSTARKMGKVFYDMGFLAKATVVECSASDLVAQFVGQTGPKVRQLLDKALGGVLFIDEAYRLAAGHFAQEAIDELTDCITKPRYHNKLVIILAGYENDINRLMSINPGLNSRFPEVIDFRNLTSKECFTLLQRMISKQQTILRNKGATTDLEIGSLTSPSTDFRACVEALFEELAVQDNWASGRDVGTVAQSVFNRALRGLNTSSGKQLVVSEEFVVEKLTTLLHERRSRGQTIYPPPAGSLQDQLITWTSAPSPLATASATSYKADTSEEQVLPPDLQKPASAEMRAIRAYPDQREAQRDPGVSDEVWEQLQQDKQGEKDRIERYAQLEEAKNSATAEARDRILKELLEEERKQKEAEEAQRKLATLGLCPAGFTWIKQANGYRCAGGSHFVDDAQLISGI